MSRPTGVTRCWTTWRDRGATAVAAAAIVLCCPGQLSGQAVWESDWTAAFERARAEEKLVMVDFYATWCKPCQFMEKEVLTKEAVQRRLAEFVLLRVDYDKARRRFGVRSIPTFVFFDPSERPHFRIHGSHSPDRFAEKLDGVRLLTRDALDAAARIENPETAAEGHLLLGRTYARAGDVAGAAAELTAAEKAALRANDAETAALARADAAYVQSLTPAGGKKALARLARADPGESVRASAYRHLLLGHVRRATGDTAGAATAFREAIERASGDERIRREAGLALASLEQIRRDR